MNLGLARGELPHRDPMFSVRIWQHGLNGIIQIKSGPTQVCWKTAAKDKAFDLIRVCILIETQAEHLRAILRAGKVSTNAILRKVHNFALDMNWLPAVVRGPFHQGPSRTR